MTTTADPDVRAKIVEALRERHRFVISSHERPDGDAIGSQLAMAFALRQLGKEVRIVNRDPPPSSLRALPGVRDILVADRVDDPGDAVIVMECGSIDRTGVAGLDLGFVINIDHHLGNRLYGALNCFDIGAAACGEIVFDLVRALGVDFSLEIATHIYLTILTDTGSFHHSSMSGRTFDICRQCVEAGVDPASVARDVFDHNSLGRLKLFGAVLSGMELDSSGRLATLSANAALNAACGSTSEDAEGLINLPLTVGDICAVVFFKELTPTRWRVSMRSKGDVDINAVATQFGGGGHKNASGCSADGSLPTLKRVFAERIIAQVEAASAAH